MKHKLKQLVTLMGTALLGNQPTMANPPLEPPSSESFRQGGNDSFFSKLDNTITAASANQTRTRTPRNGGRFSFSQENYDVYEEEGSINIEVERTSCSSGSPPVSIKYASHNGTAISEEDYHAVKGTLTWGASGDCDSKTFNVPITDDSAREGNETIHLKLNDPSGEVEFAQSDAVLTIIDNESSVVGFSQENYFVNEADGNATFTVERTDCINGLSSPVSVSYMIIDGSRFSITSAIGTSGYGGDYVAYDFVKNRESYSRGNLTWEKGDCVPKTFDIQIINNSELEYDETTNLVLHNPVGTTLNNSQATLIIIDDDKNSDGSSLIEFFSRDYTIDESNSQAIIWVARIGCDSDSPPVSVSYTSRDGSAISGEDYQGVTGILTWGENGNKGDCDAKWFNVPIIDDFLLESEREILYLELDSPTGDVKLGTQTKAELTIVDDEKDGSIIGFSTENYYVNEGDKSVNITVERTNCLDGLTGEILVFLKNTDEGTAKEYSDFRIDDNYVQWNADHCDSKRFKVDIKEDSQFEGDETIILELYSYSHRVTVAQSQATLTIQDNQPLWGTAILVAGRTHPNDSLFPYSNEYTQRLYRLLQERGFQDEDIYYLNPLPPDIDGDGSPEPERQDYPLLNPVQELAKAFEATGKNLPAGQPFLFYWHGHARPDYLKIHPDYELSAKQLNQLLENIPADSEQLIILDGCYSGSFLDELQGVANRIVLTSADDINKACDSRYGGFSDFLIQELRRGESVGNAFFNARGLITSQLRFGNQYPWLDDDGDGQYTSSDGNRAINTYLGGETENMAPKPEIVQISPPLVLTDNTANATLWLTVAEPILKARAILLKPDLPFLEYQGEATYFARTELELHYNEVTERYESVYDYFCHGGIRQILYQVQSENGVWSDIHKSEVQQTSNSQAPVCLTPLTVKMDLNQTRYTDTGRDTLQLEMTVDGVGEADLYVAIVLPEGDFITLSYPEKWNSLNIAQPYLSAIHIAGNPVYPLLNLPISPGLAFGNYSACGILVPPNADALNQSHWIHSDCAKFEIYGNSSNATDLSTFRDTLQDGSLGPEMVWIPAGTFRMGDIQGGGDSDEQPVHEVSVERFSMGRYEVSNAEFVHFLNTVKRRGTEEKPWFETQAEDVDSHIIGSPGNFKVKTGYENHPMIEVSWYGATAYAEWLSQQTGHQYRLPTEAEWEYAARAGTETKYWWGNKVGSNKANCDSCGSQWDDKQTAPVGSFAANPYGLYDTAGNVWEWTCSEYESSYNGKEEYCVSDAGRLSFRGGAWSSDAGGAALGLPQLERADVPQRLRGLPGCLAITL
jgi:formylglycine-generating enzyme required for sulfatase activity